MGGAITAEPGRTGRKPVDAVLNLVPFIDLLSSLIAFLLMTAVWAQLSALAASSAGGAAVPDVPAPGVTVYAGSAGFTVHAGDLRREIPKVDGVHDVKTLSEVLSGLRHTLEGEPTVQVMPDDDVSYESVVGVLDASNAAGMPNVTVVGR
ncbi:MAG: biopolymer transporter ExbD [Deltaproteobacteria bacterium]|nr:biopolymer transporter ExbD [Deltaproteobacteria bacterium]